MSITEDTAGCVIDAETARIEAEAEEEAAAEEANFRAGQLDGLQEVVDFLKAHPDVPIPYTLRGDHMVFPRGTEEEVLTELARIAKIISPCEKTLSPSGMYYGLVKRFSNGFTLQFLGNREQICTAKKIGTTTVNKRVEVQPAVYEDKEVEQDVIEWECKPLLKGEA